MPNSLPKGGFRGPRKPVEPPKRGEAPRYANWGLRSPKLTYEIIKGNILIVTSK